MESIIIQISAADKAMLKRIAKSVDRRSADLNQLIFARGLEFFFCEEHVWVDKLPDEYTEEERQQQEKNKAIRENPEINGWEAQQKAGYVQVRDSLTNHEAKPDGDGCHDPLIEPIAKRLRAIATA
tara:strand:+ start:137 stop:514 length:378 start_codon:yes stop_codon:yes gene_type:complete